MSLQSIFWYRKYSFKVWRITFTLVKTFALDCRISKSNIATIFTNILLYFYISTAKIMRNKVLILSEFL